MRATPRRRNVKPQTAGIGRQIAARHMRRASAGNAVKAKLDDLQSASFNRFGKLRAIVVVNIDNGVLERLAFE